MINIDPQHAQEFTDSAISDDIAALNFRSWNPEDENDLDQVFTLLIPEPKHNNNCTLSGTSQQELAAILRSGCWVFQGYKGVCVKPNNPRKDKDGKVIKYESPRGAGSLQLFIPRVSWASGRKIAAKAGLDAEYLERMSAIVNPTDEDRGFWEWFLTTGLPIIITEGSKKACSLISAGYPAIALNGIWGYGTNVKDMFGNVEKDECGKSVKTLHPDLEPFLDGREIVLALDREEKPEKKRMVEAAKAAFVRAISDDDLKVTQLTWRTPKGIDDYITARGVAALDRLYSKRKEIATEEPKPERITAGDTLLEICKTPTYFHTPDKVAYADIWIEGNRHTYPVRSRAFRLWLSGEYLDRTGKGVSSQPLQDALNTAEAIAIHKSDTHDVHLRTAEQQGKIYLDLGTPDWKAIEIDAIGWRAVSEPPVRFWRPDTLLPLPYPVEGGSVEELKEILNVDRNSWTLIITFLLFCYYPKYHKPILILHGEQGSGKTTMAEFLKSLIDPGKAGLLPAISDVHRMAVAASRRWLLVYDNLSGINAEQSDALCRISTGGGFSTRTLHTTGEETVFEFIRPQIITGIDSLATRGDLLQRSLMAALPSISPGQRKTRAELESQLDRVRPRILGALLTALSQTLKVLPDTHPPELIRMADFGRFAIASEQALGLKPGDFIRAFESNQGEGHEIVMESDPVAQAISRLMADRTVWEGTASQLLSDLEPLTPEKTVRSRQYPGTPARLGKALIRIAPNLRGSGIDLSIERSNNSRKILLEKSVILPSLPSLLSPLSQGKGLSGDSTVTAVTVETSLPSPAVTPTVTSEIHSVISSQPSRDDSDGSDSKKIGLSESGDFKLKVGDLVTTPQNQSGPILEFRTKTTPKGTPFEQALVDLGGDRKWLDLDILSLEVC